MITNNAVTFWHYDEAQEQYIRKQVSKVWAKLSDKAESDGAKGGQRLKKICTIRIPAGYTLELQLDIGDYVRLGIHDGEPERGCDMKIVSISDNHYGQTPHWRICCE